MQNRAFLILSLNWTLLKARFDGEKLTLQHWHGQTPRLRERERRQNFERVCKFDFMPSASAAAASVCMYVCVCCALVSVYLAHIHAHMYERIRKCSGARVCLSIYVSVFVCVCVRVFDGDHARSAAALSNREHVRERAEAAAKRDTAQNAGSFFSLLSFFFLYNFFSCSFLGFFFTAFQI